MTYKIKENKKIYSSYVIAIVNPVVKDNLLVTWSCLTKYDNIILFNIKQIDDTIAWKWPPNYNNKITN